jgi:predicted LPLAT superfamily acyltransferase
MSPSWKAQHERGSQLLLRFMVWLTLTFGWRAGHALLHPITAYFVLFSGKARASSRSFLRIVTGREPGLRAVFRHYFTFSLTILDRPFLLTGRIEDYDIRVFGLEAVTAYIDAGTGLFLLGAHVGSFEVLRALADAHCAAPVKALMYEDNATRANEVFNRLNPGRPADVIPIGAPDTMLRVKEALDAGALVGILGDRITHGDKTVEVSFCGRPARFPLGPMILASVLGAPVVLFFGIHRGNRRYDVYFEPFADRLVTSRQTRGADLKAWVQRYASRVEAMALAHPGNWFNFYDFWEDGNVGSTSSEARSGRSGTRRLSVRRVLSELRARRNGRRGLADRHPHGDVVGSEGKPRQLS